MGTHTRRNGTRNSNSDMNQNELKSRLCDKSSLSFSKDDPQVKFKERQECLASSDTYYMKRLLGCLSALKPVSNTLKKTTLTVWFYFLYYFLFVCFWIYNFVNGTYSKINASRQPENFSWSAQVLRVIGRNKYDALVDLNRRSDFILIHSGFDHPRRVLADEVSLYEINEKEAIFVESPPGIEVWRSKFNAFHNAAQHRYAVNLIIMPIHSFNKLAEEIGDPGGKMVFITNTARCGSTLLTQIFEKTDEFVTLAEPTAINYLHKFVGCEDDPWARTHTRNIIRMLCKPTCHDNFVIKITPMSTKILQLVHTVYPEASQLFIYRDGLPVCRSLYKVCLGRPLGYINILAARFLPGWVYVNLLDYSGYYNKPDSKEVTLGAGYGQFCFYWGSVISIYLQHYRSGFPITGVKYEDLVDDKEFGLESIFKYCGIPSKWTKLALRAFDCDSQENSEISMKRVRSTPVPDMTPENQDETDKICAYFGLAKLGESCVLEGTITRRDVDM